MRRFSDVLNDLGLRDLPLQGGHYTWQGGSNGRSMAPMGEPMQQGDPETPA